MSQLRTALNGPKGAAIVVQVIGSVAALVATSLEPNTGPSIVLEVCTLVHKRMPKSYQRQTVWAGTPSVDDVQRIAASYGRKLAPMNIGNRTRVHDFDSVGHFVTGGSPDDPTCILVIVAGLPSANCRRLAQYAATGIVAGLTLL